MDEAGVLENTNYRVGNLRVKLNFSRLHEEILDFAEYIKPTQEEMLMRQDVVERIRKCVLALWPKAKVFWLFCI